MTDESKKPDRPPMDWVRPPLISQVGAKMLDPLTNRLIDEAINGRSGRRPSLP